MRRIFTAVCLLFFLVACGGNDGSGAIKVNGTWLSADEVDKVAQVLKEEIQRSRPEAALSSMAEVRRAAARQLIANQLMLDEGRRMGIEFSDSLVDAAFRSVLGTYSDEQIALGLEESGKSEAQMKSYVREGLVVDSVLQLVLMTVDSVTEPQCRAYYDSNPERFTEPGRIRASQILLVADSADNAQAGDVLMARAKALSAQARRGASFASLARKHSKGPNARDGGDIGWFSHGDILPEVEAAAMALKKGDVSEPVQSRIGLHVIRKTGEEPPRKQEYEKARLRIRMKLTMDRQAERLQSYSDSLITAADVEYADTSLAPQGK